MYKQGDILVSPYGYERKVLGTCGEVLFLSCDEEFDRAFNLLYTMKQLNEGNWKLKQQDWKLKRQEWEPKIKDVYYTIATNGTVFSSVWEDDSTDLGRKNFLGIFPTRELAQQRLKEIKKLLK